MKYPGARCPGSEVIMRQRDASENSALLGTKDAARLLNVDPTTLREYERKGVVRPARTSTGMRVYTFADIARIRAHREARRP